MSQAVIVIVGVFFLGMGSYDRRLAMMLFVHQRTDVRVRKCVRRWPRRSRHTPHALPHAAHRFPAANPNGRSIMAGAATAYRPMPRKNTPTMTITAWLTVTS